MKKDIYTVKTFLHETAAKSIGHQVEAMLAVLPDEAILAAAANPLSQVPGTEKASLTKLIFVNETADRIRYLLKKTGLSISEIINVVATAAIIQSTERSATGTPLARWLAWSDRQPQEGQDAFYQHLSTSFAEKKVGLCEASTGSGKTAAILAAVADTIERTGTSALIATSAVALVKDFAVEHTRMGKDAPALRVFLGMGEFVSDQELRAFIVNWVGFAPQVSAIEAWLDKGAPSQETGVSQCYLKHSLRHLSPDIPLEEVLLRDTEDDADPGMRAYRQQFHKAGPTGTKEILLCTHAMLAVDLRIRLAVAARSGNLAESHKQVDHAWKQVKANKADNLEMTDSVTEVRQALAAWDKTARESSAGMGKLPDYSYLVIDEAHLLEQYFSNALSSYVAIHQFMLHARDLAQKGLLPKGAVGDIEHAYYSLCQSAKDQGADTLHISQLNEAILAPLQLIATVAKAGLGKIGKKRLGSLPPEHLAARKRFQADAEAIAQAARAIPGQIAYLSLSPRLAYPRLFVGRASVDQYLRFLWSLVEGAACVSATLYLPKDDGVSSWYMQSILAIPPERKLDFDPVIPRWIRETVAEINMPACGAVAGHTPLRPASRGDKLTADEKEQRDLIWCQAVAEALTGIYATAAGGCLVLMTSYSYINKVKAELLRHPHIAPNLIFAQQGELATKDKPKTQPITLDEQRRQFLRLAFAGKKPIWLALGNAWTGINLSGGDVMAEVCGSQIPAQEDNVLTDLIIPRLPFGVNKSVTHTYRTTHNKKVAWDRIDTLLRLRQGTGRLVRRPGVPKNRRIHLLDARLCDGILASMWKAVYRAVGGG